MERKKTGNDLRKSRLRHKLRLQAVVTEGALLVSLAFLIAAFVLSSRCIASLEERVLPLIDEAGEAARSGELEKVSELGKRIDETLREYREWLMLFASHRDIMELYRSAAELVELGMAGEGEDYISALSGVRAYLELLKENNGAGFGNIL